MEGYNMDKRLDLGGEGQLVQMLHANAYTPECYTKFLQPFVDKSSVGLYRQRPLWHGESPKQLKHWSLFADDLIDMMDASGQKGVIGMGHSLGGVATFLASLKRPDLFSQLILIDPVFIGNSMSSLLSLMPKALKYKLLPIIKIAANRRNHWPSRKDVRAHLGSKKVFQRFDDDVFDDFINYGIVDQADGVGLAYPREWEAKVYETAPNIWEYLKKSKVPTHIIKAEYSNVISTKAWTRIKRTMSNATFYEMKGCGHLVPFEKPKLLSAHILEKLTMI